MERVMVVGTSSSGKTTLARRVADSIGAEHIELDALHWGPNWTGLPRDVFRDIVRRRAGADRWVIDGNYGAVQDIVMARATDALWLDYPLAVVFCRAVRRTWRRVVTGEELFGGNRETFFAAFFRPDAIPWWVVRTHFRHRRTYPERFARYPDIRLTRLTGQSEADAFVRRLAVQGESR
ncbi:MAG: adenylate kinase [Candidatus Eisenbacteria bacterium]|nr:adenylate kinase [Candidatus Eisenbacteria bacterium]